MVTQCIVLVDVPKNAQPQDEIRIECRLDGLRSLRSGQGGMTEYDAENLVRDTITNLVYGYREEKLQFGNRLFRRANETVPNQFLWHDGWTRYLITAHLFALTLSLLINLIFESNPLFVVIASIGHQLSLCAALLSYFLLFVRAQFDQASIQTNRPGITHRLFAISSYKSALFAISLLLFLASLSIRLAYLLVLGDHHDKR